MNINIIYCPTERMVVDYFTKSLKVLLFSKLRDVIMGVTHPISLLTEEPPPSKERIKKSVVLMVSRKESNHEYVTSGGVKLGTVPNPLYTGVVKLRGG